MKLSKESQYALAAMLELAAAPLGTYLQARHVAQARGLPASFLPKILHKLVRHGLLRSLRGGRERGYALARPPESITVREIVDVIEGPDLLDRCVFWSDTCSDARPCLLHDLWKQVRPTVMASLERVTVADLALTAPSPVPRRSRPGRRARSPAGALL